MELKELQAILRAKPINRGAVVLTVEEYQAVMTALSASAPKRGRPKKSETVPREATR